MSYKLKPFTNLLIYSIEGFNYGSVESICSALSQSVFTPCLESDYSRDGWVSSHKDSGKPLFFKNESGFIVLYCYEYKYIPNSLINQKVNNEISQWKRSTGYKRVKRVVREQIKRDITFKELRIAHTKKQIIPVWFDLKSQRLCINTKQKDKAEAIIHKIRMNLGSLPAIPIVSESQTIKGMTELAALGGSDNFKVNDSGRFQMDDQEVTISGSDFPTMANKLIQEGYQSTRILLKSNDIEFFLESPFLLWDMKFPNLRTGDFFTEMTDICRDSIDSILQVIHE